MYENPGGGAHGPLLPMPIDVTVSNLRDLYSAFFVNYYILIIIASATVFYLTSELKSTWAWSMENILFCVILYVSSIRKRRMLWMNHFLWAIRCIEPIWNTYCVITVYNFYSLDYHGSSSAISMHLRLFFKYYCLEWCHLDQKAKVVFDKLYLKA